MTTSWHYVIPAKAGIHYNSMLPDSIKNLITEFKKLPSIGPRQATRLAFHLSRYDHSSLAEFVAALSSLKNLSLCSLCFLTHQNQSGLCNICSDPKRNPNIIAVVEKETDLLSMERAQKFKGRYFILGELGRGGVLEQTQKNRLAILKNRLSKISPETEQEIVLAISPTTYGDLAASLISQELLGSTKKITRLGRGIPTGGEIEFADEETLGHAIDNRN